MNGQKTKKNEVSKPEINSRDDFLKWRDAILEKYEKDKIDYLKEMHIFLGYDDKDNQ